MNKSAGKTINIRFLAATGCVAAVYATLTMAVAPLAFGAVQFRLTECLTLLAWVNPAFVPALTLGCAIVNLFSPLGPADILFGTLHTFISTFLMSRTKNMFAASLWPAAFSFIIGLELRLALGEPFLISTLSVAAGEFVCISILGCAIFTILRKNNALMNMLRSIKYKA